MLQGGGGEGGVWGKHPILYLSEFILQYPNVAKIDLVCRAFPEYSFSLWYGMKENGILNDIQFILRSRQILIDKIKLIKNYCLRMI